MKKLPPRKEDQHGPEQDPVDNTATMSPNLLAQASAAEPFSDNNFALSSVSDELEDDMHVTARLLVSEYRDDSVNRHDKQCSYNCSSDSSGDADSSEDQEAQRVIFLHPAAAVVK